MCVIIMKTAGASPVPAETLSNCFRANNQGAGFAASVGNKLITRRGFTEDAKFQEAVEEYNRKGTALLLHWRIATGSNKKERNCHPHPCGENHVVAHNGTLQGVDSTESESDTRRFVKNFLRPFIVGGGSVGNNVCRAVLEEYLGKRNSVVVMNKFGTFWILNEGKKTIYGGDAHWKDGCWYSNESFQPEFRGRNTSPDQRSRGYTPKIVPPASTSTVLGKHSGGLAKSSSEDANDEFLKEARILETRFYREFPLSGDDVSALEEMAVAEVELFNTEEDSQGELWQPGCKNYEHCIDYYKMKFRRDLIDLKLDNGFSSAYVEAYDNAMGELHGNYAKEAEPGKGNEKKPLLKEKSSASTGTNTKKTSTARKPGNTGMENRHTDSDFVPWGIASQREVPIRTQVCFKCKTSHALTPRFWGMTWTCSNEECSHANLNSMSNSARIQVAKWEDHSDNYDWRSNDWLIPFREETQRSIFCNRGLMFLCAENPFARWCLSALVVLIQQRRFSDAGELHETLMGLVNSNKNGAASRYTHGKCADSILNFAHVIPKSKRIGMYKFIQEKIRPNTPARKTMEKIDASLGRNNFKTNDKN